MKCTSIFNTLASGRFRGFSEKNA